MIIPADHAIRYYKNNLTPENLPKFVKKLKASLSDSHQPLPSTSKQTAPYIKPTTSIKGVSPWVKPPQKNQSPKSSVRQANRSPISDKALLQLKKSIFSARGSGGDGMLGFATLPHFSHAQTRWAESPSDAKTSTH